MAPTADVVCGVKLVEDVLTLRSLGKLIASGLDLTGTPILESTLPGPLVGN